MIMRYYYEARIRNYKLVDQAVHRHNQNRKRAALNISRGINIEGSTITSRGRHSNLYVRVRASHQENSWRVGIPT